MSLRLDKWLWYARFVKTRSLATKLCAAGGMRVDGTPVSKPHFSVRPGQILTFPLHNHVRVIKVLALAERRGPASEAQTLYEDLAPPQRENALPRPPKAPSPGKRPDKRARRQLRDLRSG